MNENNHGGKRAGAGRPKGTTGAYKEETAKAHQIKLTDHEWEIYQKAGGTKNLRKLIRLGKFRKII